MLAKSFTQLPTQKLDDEDEYEEDPSYELSKTRQPNFALESPGATPPSRKEPALIPRTGRSNDTQDDDDLDLTFTVDQLQSNREASPPQPLERTASTSSKRTDSNSTLEETLKLTQSDTGPSQLTGSRIAGTNRRETSRREAEEREADEEFEFKPTQPVVQEAAKKKSPPLEKKTPTTPMKKTEESTSSASSSSPEYPSKVLAVQSKKASRSRSFVLHDEVSWNSLWKHLRKTGWTYKAGGVLTTWKYYLPEAAKKDEPKHLVDYFRSEDEVFAFCSRNTEHLQGLSNEDGIDLGTVKFTVPKSSPVHSNRRSRSKNLTLEKSASDENAFISVKNRKRVGEQEEEDEKVSDEGLWKVCWKLLREKGWSYKSGKGLVSWVFLAPGVKSVNDGRLNETLFESENDALAWVQEHDNETYEEALALLNGSSPQKPLQKARTAAPVMSKQIDTSKTIPKTQQTQRSGRKSEKEADVEEPQPERQSVESEENSSDSEMDDDDDDDERDDATIESLNPEKLWNACWIHLKEQGWSHRNGKGLVSWVFLAPGVKTTSEGKLNETMFASEEDLMKWIKVNDPESFRFAVKKLMEETKSMDHAKALKSGETIVPESERIWNVCWPILQQRGWTSQKNGSSSIYYPAHIDDNSGESSQEDGFSSKDDVIEWVQKNENRLYRSAKEVLSSGLKSFPALEEVISFDPLWKHLRNNGWTYKKGRGLVNWYFVLPGRKKEEGRRHVDYFVDTSEVFDYCVRHPEQLKGLEVKDHRDMSTMFFRTYYKRPNVEDISPPKTSKSKLSLSSSCSEVFNSPPSKAKAAKKVAEREDEEDSIEGSYHEENSTSTEGHQENRAVNGKRSTTTTTDHSKRKKIESVTRKYVPVEEEAAEDDLSEEYENDHVVETRASEEARRTKELEEEKQAREVESRKREEEARQREAEAKLREAEVAQKASALEQANAKLQEQVHQLFLQLQEHQQRAEAAPQLAQETPAAIRKSDSKLVPQEEIHENKKRARDDQTMSQVTTQGEVEVSPASKRLQEADVPPQVDKFFTGYRFLITGFDSTQKHLSSFSEHELAGSIGEAGGLVAGVDTWSMNTDTSSYITVVRPGTYRTEKYLAALLFNRPIVHPQYITDCMKYNKMLPIESYKLPRAFYLPFDSNELFSIKSFEQIPSASWDDSKNVPISRSLLEGFQVSVIGKSFWSLVASYLGASVVPFDPLGSEKVLVLNDEALQIPPISPDRLMNLEWLLQCVLHQEKLPLSSNYRFQYRKISKPKSSPHRIATSGSLETNRGMIALDVSSNQAITFNLGRKRYEVGDFVVLRVRNQPIEEYIFPRPLPPNARFGRIRQVFLVEGCWRVTFDELVFRENKWLLHWTREIHECDLDMIFYKILCVPVPNADAAKSLYAQHQAVCNENTDWRDRVYLLTLF